MGDKILSWGLFVTAIMLELYTGVIWEQSGLSKTLAHVVAGWVR